MFDLPIIGEEEVQHMGKITADQLQAHRPWTNVSLDYAGPFSLLKEW